MEAVVRDRVEPSAWLAAAESACRGDLPARAEQAAGESAAGEQAVGAAPAGAAGLVGLVGGGVPREAVLAAGFVPVELQPAVLDAGAEPVPSGLQLSRPAAAVYSALRAGRLAALDALVVGRGSESFTKLFHVLRELASRRQTSVPPLHFHDQLAVASPSAAAYNRRRLAELLDRLGAWAGRRAGGDELASAIAEQNALAAVLRAADELRRLDEPAMRGGEVLALAGAARRLPTLEARRLVDAALAERTPSPLAPPPGRVAGAAPLRLVLSGSDHDHLALYGELESSAVTVVGEDHGFGMREWSLEVAEDGDPLAALLERDTRLARLDPVPARSGIAERVESVLARLRRLGATSVLQLVVEGDEAPGWETPALAAALRAGGAGFGTLTLPWPGRAGATGALAALAAPAGVGAGL